MSKTYTKKTRKAVTGGIIAAVVTVVSLLLWFGPGPMLPVSETLRQLEEQCEANPGMCEESPLPLLPMVIIAGVFALPAYAFAWASDRRAWRVERRFGKFMARVDP